MKTQDIFWAVAAFGAAGLLFIVARKQGAGAASQSGAGQDAAALSTWEIERRQTAITQDAIDRNWQELRDGILRSQPDWWV